MSRYTENNDNEHGDVLDDLGNTAESLKDNAESLYNIGKKLNGLPDDTLKESPNIADSSDGLSGKQGDNQNKFGENPFSDKHNNPVQDNGGHSRFESPLQNAEFGDDAEKLKAASEAGKAAAGKAAGKAAGTAAAGAATGGVAAAAIAAADLATKAGKEALSIIKQEKNVKKQSNSSNGSGWLALVAIIIFPLVVITGIFSAIPGASVVYTGNQAKNAEDTNTDYSSSTGILHNDYTSGGLDENSLKFYDDISHLNYYDTDNLFSESSKAQVQIVDSTLQKAHQQARADVQAAIDANDYDEDLTWESFDRWGYPFVDINYAEFMTVWAQNKDFNFEKANQKQFDAYTSNASNLRHLYRLSITTAWKLVFVGYDDDGDPEYEWVKYGKCKYCKYYLKDLYAFAKVDPNADYYNYTGFDTSKYNGTDNLSVLDTFEQILRTFGNFVSSTIFGTNARTPMDGGFPAEPAENDYGTGGTISHSEYGFANVGGLSETAKSTMKTLYNGLLGCGLSEAAAAGICGNIWQESNFSPTARSSSGTYHGLVQWGNNASSGYKWQKVQEYASSHGLSVDSVEAQIGYILNSEIPSLVNKMSKYIMNHGGGSIYNTTNSALAAEACAIYMEGCIGGGKNSANMAANGKYYQDLGQRKKYAETLFNCKGDPTNIHGGDGATMQSDGTIVGKLVSSAFNFVHSGLYQYSKTGNRHGSDGTFDCSGLVNTVFKNAGISTPDTTGSWFDSADSLVKSGRWIKVSYDQLQPGDVALYRHSDGSGHTGIVGYSNNLLNAKGKKYGLVDQSLYSKDFKFGMRYVA